MILQTGQGDILKCISVHDWFNAVSIMKSVYKKVPSCFLERDTMPFAPLKNNVGVYALSMFTGKCRLKLVNILNLAKSITWQNKSVGWGIV